MQSGSGSSEADADAEREGAAQRWRDLAHDISVARRNPSPPRTDGSLVILGSGIASMGFTRDAEAELRAADSVFFCVADPPTAAWIRALRPDAYDLYVLYEDTRPRYHTYVQMTEAMLHCLRRGERVAAVYYGHPGIFVLSTHRAVEIARREGLRAQMRPGVSALDCLCADLGVDPAQPGMLTYEATDLPIIGRPRSSSPQRRAAHPRPRTYTLNCEEPVSTGTSRRRRRRQRSCWLS